MGSSGYASPVLAADANAAIALVNNGTGTITISRRQTDTTIPSIENTGTYCKQRYGCCDNLSASEVEALTTISILCNIFACNTVTSIATTETVSADTIQGDGTNYVTYSNNGGFVQINAAGTSSFSGVLSDGDTTGTPLASGDTVCNCERITKTTLQHYNEFVVSTNSRWYKRHLVLY